MKRWQFLLLLAVLPIVVYAPSLRWPLLDYDDPIYVSQSPIVQSPGLSGLVLAWARPYFHDYIPLTHTTLWVDGRWGRANPLPFRLQGLGWHVLATFLFFHAARRWTGSEGAARAAALLFAVHPLCVESVAWVAARKNVVSLPLFLAAYLAWVRGETSRPILGRLGSAVLFLSSLLAKAASIGLPLVIFADSWLLRRKRVARALLDALPFAIIAAVWLYWAAGLRHDVPEKPLAGPVGIAAVDLQVLARYVLNTLLPLRLSAFYYVDLHGFAVPWPWMALGGLIACLGTPFLWLSDRKRGAFLLLCALAGSLPVLNLVPQPHPIADRFFYWSLPPLLCFLVVSVSEALRRLPRPAGAAGFTTRRRLEGSLAGVAVVVLAALSFARVGVWRSSMSLFEDAVRCSPLSSIAHMHLADKLASQPSSESRSRAAEQFRIMLSCPDAEVRLKQGVKDTAAVAIAEADLEKGLGAEADSRIARRFEGRETEPDAVLLLARYDLAARRPARAIERLEPLVHGIPGLTDFGRALLLSEEMPYRRAPIGPAGTRDSYIANMQRQALGKALRLLGRAYQSVGRPRDAAIVLGVASTIPPLTPALLGELSEAYRAAGLPQRADAAARDAASFASRGRRE